MPPEQLMGRANKTTDLYGLGATLAHLATGHHPSMIPEERARLKWRQFASIDGRLADFIDSLLEPIWEDRPAGAREALDALDDSLKYVPDEKQSTALVSTSTDGLVRRRPADCFVSVEKDARHITIRIPPKFVRLDWNLVGVGALISAATLAIFVSTGVTWLLPVAVLGIVLIIAAMAFSHRAAVLTANHSGWSLKMVRAGFFTEQDWFDAPVAGARTPNAFDRFPGTFDLVVHDTDGRPLDTGLRPEEVSWLVYEINSWVEANRPAQPAFRQR
jgi:hypothetical protein